MDAVKWVSGKSERFFGPFRAQVVGVRPNPECRSFHLLSPGLKANPPASGWGRLSACVYADWADSFPLTPDTTHYKRLPDTHQSYQGTGW